VRCRGGDFVTTIQRSAFGMTYGLPMIPDITDCP